CEAEVGGDGHFSTRRDPAQVSPAELAEATAFGVAGLAAARAMGDADTVVESTLLRSKRTLTSLITKGGVGQPARAAERGTRLSALAVTVLALSIANAPADARSIDLVGQTLVTQATFGTPAQGWVQGVMARAMAELAGDGRAALLGPTPVSVIPT